MLDIIAAITLVLVAIWAIILVATVHGHCKASAEGRLTPRQEHLFILWLVLWFMLPVGALIALSWP